MLAVDRHVLNQVVSYRQRIPVVMEAEDASALRRLWSISLDDSVLLPVQVTILPVSWKCTTWVRLFAFAPSRR